MWLKTHEFVAPVAVAHLLTDVHPDSGFKLDAQGWQEILLAPATFSNSGAEFGWMDSLELTSANDG
jgi:hypothetical protein